MLRELIKIANKLDQRGLFKEADTLDLMIKEALPHWGDLLKSWGIMGDSANEFLEEFLTGWERRPAVAERLRNRPWYYYENYERMEWAMVSELRSRRGDLEGYEDKLRKAMKRIYDSFQARINREEDSGIPSWDWVQDYDKRSSPKYNNYNGPFVYVADKSGQAPGFRLVDKDGNDWPNYPTESDISKDERFFQNSRFASRRKGRIQMEWSCF